MNSLLPIVKLLFGDSNFGLTKIKNTTYESVYACESSTMLRKDKFYLFVIGSVDVIPIGSNVRIEDVGNISCIQLRTFSEPILQKVIKQKIEFMPNSNNIRITKYNITKDSNSKISEYMFEYNDKPYNVHLFHTTDSDFEYVNEGSLYSALITWNTMIINSINVTSKPTLQQQSIQQHKPTQQRVKIEQPYLTDLTEQNQSYDNTDELLNYGKKAVVKKNPNPVFPNENKINRKYSEYLKRK
jgi:hypothetical protein